MTFSLYDATIPVYQQILGAVARLLEKAQDFAATSGLDEQDILDARLAPDMLPFAYQVKSTAVHSIGAGGNTDFGLIMNGGTVRLSGTGGDQIYINTGVQINGGTFDMNGLSEGFDRIREDPTVAMDLIFGPTWNPTHRLIKAMYWGAPIMLLVSAILWVRRPKPVHAFRR